MKRIVFAVLLATLLVGCSSAEGASGEKDGLPNGFTFVENSKLHGDYITVSKNKITGCYYIFVNGGYESSVGGIQMFVEKNGKSVPYCGKSGDSDSGEAFTFIKENKLHGDYVTVARHNKTGTYYTVLNGGYESDVSVIQMFVEKNGESVPYAD
jgi:hypothetical protein